MDNIKRNTDPLKGPPDGVVADVQCVVTQFDRKKEKGRRKKGVERVIKAQASMPCKIFCAYSDGTVGFSVRDADLMLTVRVDELFELMKAAADAAQELQDSMPQEYTDAELETRWKERATIELESADSPSGEVLSEKWWIFPKGTDKDDILKYFDERHSKGLSYLIDLV